MTTITNISYFRTLWVTCVINRIEPYFHSYNSFNMLIRNTTKCFFTKSFDPSCHYCIGNPIKSEQFYISNYNFTLLTFHYTFNNLTTDCPILNFPQIIPDTIKHLLRSVCHRLNSRSSEGRSIEAMPSKSGIKLGSCTICPSSVFHSATEKQGHFSIFHHDYTHQQSIKQTETEH